MGTSVKVAVGVIATGAAASGVAQVKPETLTAAQRIDRLEQIVVTLHERVTRLEQSAGGRANARAPSGAVIQSRINGDFEGWNGDTIFKLMNGQIWQQASPAYAYHYAFMPEVTIVKDGGGYKMMVDGMSGSIRVRRLQ